MGQLVMDLKSDAAHTKREDAKRWREADVAESERRVRRLQARIVQATERGRWKKKNAFPELSPRWVVGHPHGLYSCLSRMLPKPELSLPIFLSRLG